MINALDQLGVSWRIAAVSPSLAGLWAAATGGLGVTARGPLGLPPGLLANATLFDLPALGSLPVTFHRRKREKSEAVERLAGIVIDLVKQTVDANHFAEDKQTIDCATQPSANGASTR
jgi:hypothetical protein